MQLIKRGLVFRFIGGVLLLMINLFLVGFLIKWQSDDLLRVVMCDVGQGDAILISYHYNQVLIDGGRDKQVLGCLNRYLPLGDRTIELVVATHMDADHIGGLGDVMASFRVKTLAINHQSKQTAVFDRFWQAVQVERKTGMRLVYVGWLDQLRLDRDLVLVSFTHPPTSGSMRSHQAVLSPDTEHGLSDKISNLSQDAIDSNNSSIVLFFKFKQVSFLFTGDLEKSGELSLINTGVLNKISVLKVGHHGSKSSSSRLFLETLTPEISLIGVGKSNSYGHPSSQVINQLLEVGSQIYRTDLMGDIVLTTNGRLIFVKTQK